MRDVGQRISETRSKRGLSRKVLAKRINKSIPSLSGYEHDTQLPPLDVLNDIAHVLNVSLDYLAGNTDDESIALKSLTSEQKEVLNLLMVEFASPTTASSGYSPEQHEIIMRLGHIFASGKPDE